MEGIKNWWNGFAEKHPSAAKWIREGGLFFIVSNLITVMKYFTPSPHGTLLWPYKLGPALLPKGISPLHLVQFF